MNVFLHPRSLLYTTFFLLILASSCKSSRKLTTSSEEKGEKEYSFSQNITTKFNILHNANQMLLEEEDKIFTASNKDFHITQSVFAEPEATGEAHQLMDSISKKAYRIINEKQKSKYINEAYFILGKANYLKGAYYVANEFFTELLRVSDNEETAKYIPLAYAWKSRTLLQINRNRAAKTAADSALITLDDVRSNNTLVNASMANYLLKTGQESKAIPYLEKALETNTRLSYERRWNFLLGKLYQKNQQYDEALASFHKTTKSNVPYEMSFEAASQIAFIEGDRSDGDINARIKPLQKMLKDYKNQEFIDQIYFYIASIYANEGKDEEAASFLRQSLNHSKGNNFQKTKGYLLLADTYFKNKKYTVAQNYYDSVSMVLPNNFPDVNRVRRRLGYMNEISTLYSEVTNIDTLLMLSRLDQSTRDNKVTEFAVKRLEDHKKLLAQKEKDIRKNKKGQRASIGNSVFMTDNSPIVSSSSDQSFYFNNPDELLVGQNLFKRKWGNRELKDNWRQSSDNSVALGQNVAQVEAQSDSIVKEKFNEDEYVAQIKATYLGKVPTAQKDIEANNKQVHNNLYLISNIYRNLIQDEPRTIEVLEELLARYPDSPSKPEILYSLFMLYAESNPAKSQKYKSELISLFPDSHFAKASQDSMYWNKLNQSKKVLNNKFEELYGLYENRNFEAVIGEVERVTSENNTEENASIVAQMKYLRALAIGRTQSINNMELALNTIVNEYGNDSLVTPLAKEHLGFIERNRDYYDERDFALEGIDSTYLAFLEEPNMTAWPSLSMNNTYTSGERLPIKQPVVAQVKKDNKVEPAKVEKPVGKVSLNSLESSQNVNLNSKGINNNTSMKTIENTAAAKIEIEKSIEKVSLGALESAQKNVSVSNGINTEVTLKNIQNKATANIELASIEFEKQNFPDTAEYYYVINVSDISLNLAPSRYGIGQFNRTRYRDNTINHYLKTVNGENQLILVGVFQSLKEVQEYEHRISPLLTEIMKVPEENYNTFVVKSDVLSSLIDSEKIEGYYKNYLEIK